jgi:hypothetical protein
MFDLIGGNGGCGLFSVRLWLLVYVKEATGVRIRTILAVYIFKCRLFLEEFSFKVEGFLNERRIWDIWWAKFREPPELNIGGAHVM